MLTIYSVRNKTEYGCTGYSDCAKGEESRLDSWHGLTVFSPSRRAQTISEAQPACSMGTGNSFSRREECEADQPPPSTSFAVVKSECSYVSTPPTGLHLRCNRGDW